MTTTEQIIKNISINLRKIRKKHNETQHEVVSSIGDYNISERTYKTYESGKGTLPELDKLLLLANHFNVSLDYLINGVDHINNDDFTWESQLKRMARLITSLVLLPFRKNELKTLNENDYVFISFDPEVSLFIDNLVSLSKKSNYRFEYLGEKMDYNLEMIDDLINDLKFKDFNISMNLERLKKVLILNEIDTDDYFKKKISEIENKRKF